MDGQGGIQSGLMPVGLWRISAMCPPSRSTVTRRNAFSMLTARRLRNVPWFAATDRLFLERESVLFRFDLGGVDAGDFMQVDDGLELTVLVTIFDNGSGLGALLEIARALQNTECRRTVRLCFFGLEEESRRSGSADDGAGRMTPASYRVAYREMREALERTYPATPGPTS